jgi:hypothetical protein
MDPKTMPYVAVVGGLWQLQEDKAAQAKEVGKAIGAELAKAGFGLVVYFSNDASLEPHVVSGYCAALADGVGSIRVRYAESQRGQIKFIEEPKHQDIFEHRLFPGQDWEVPFYRSLAEQEAVDAVVLLGGSTSTLIAGQIAVARRLPILAVDEFGGSAAKIWNQLAQAFPDNSYPSWGKRTAEKFVEQLKQQCMEVAARRTVALRREQMLTEIIAQRNKVSIAAAAFVLLLVSLFFGMAYTPVPAFYPLLMLAGLVTGGATGALVRAVHWGPAEIDPRTSLLLGSIAGFVVGLAYLIPQWVSSSGLLAPKATDVVTATDKIQFVSAVLVAISAGVGFDTVFSRLQKQAQDNPIGPPR